MSFAVSAQAFSCSLLIFGQSFLKSHNSVSLPNPERRIGSSLANIIRKIDVASRCRIALARSSSAVIGDPPLEGYQQIALIPSHSEGHRSMRCQRSDTKNVMAVGKLPFRQLSPPFALYRAPYDVLRTF